MTYWWETDQEERFWVEIRKVPGIGTGLVCPDHQINHDGSAGRNAWYELVRSVRAGDVIYHYSERENRFVGRSVAAFDAVHDTTKHSYEVDLQDFEPIAASIDLTYLRERSETLKTMRDALRAEHPGQTLYMPFQFRETGLYGMMSNYFAKLPRSVQHELFGADGLGQAVLPTLPDEPTSDIEISTGAPRGGFLRPFVAKADSRYLASVVGGRQSRSRRHERLINTCAAWLEAQGFEPMRNAAVDLGLDAPPVIIEGKTVGRVWASAIREAVSQLYEYRYFKVTDPKSALVFLAEREVPQAWIQYLESDREIGVMWPTPSGYEMSPRARSALRL